MKNLFKELKKEKINHFVTVSKPAVGVFSGGVSESITYTVYVLVVDIQKYLDGKKKGLTGKFRKSDDNPELFMIEMNKGQTKEFKGIQEELYEKVNVIENGCIYELKKNSFKEHYEDFKVKSKEACMGYV